MKKVILIGMLLIMLPACRNTAPSDISEQISQTSAAESSDTLSESVKIAAETEPIIENTTAETEFNIEKVEAVQQPLSEIKTEDIDLFSKNYNNGEPIFDDSGGYYYKKFEDKKSLYPILYYDNGDGNPIKTNLPESRCFFYDLVFHNDALYGVLHQDLKEERFFIMKYQNESLEMIINDPIEHWCFAEEGIYYQIDNAIYLTNYGGINSELIVEIPDELYTDSHNCEYLRGCRFVVYHGSIWYHHYSYFDKVDVPFWSYDIETKVFTQIDTGIDQAKLEAVNNGFLYFSSTNGLWRLNTDTYCIEQVSERYCCSVNFFNDNIIFTTEQTGKSEVYKINSDGITKMFDENNKEFGYDEPYYNQISTYKDRIFLNVTSGAYYSKIVEIDLDGKILKQISEY